MAGTKQTTRHHIKLDKPHMRTTRIQKQQQEFVIIVTSSSSRPTLPSLYSIDIPSCSSSSSASSSSAKDFSVMSPLHLHTSFHNSTLTFSIHSLQNIPMNTLDFRRSTMLLCYKWLLLMLYLSLLLLCLFSSDNILS